MNKIRGVKSRREQHFEAALYIIKYEDCPRDTRGSCLNCPLITMIYDQPKDMVQGKFYYCKPSTRVEKAKQFLREKYPPEDVMEYLL